MHCSLATFRPLFVRLGGLACLALCLTGCSSTEPFRWSFAGKTTNDKAGPRNPVVQIVPTWQEGEGPDVNPEYTTRGFTGQIYFITDRKGLPSEVDGTIDVYVFDDFGDHEEKVKPLHIFNFPPEATKLHLVQTKLGPAYSMFIPYTRKGLHRADCALRIKFTPREDGNPTYSKMVSIVLPGAKTEAQIAMERQNDGVEDLSNFVSKVTVDNRTEDINTLGITPVHYLKPANVNPESSPGPVNPLAEPEETPAQGTVRTFTIPVE